MREDVVGSRREAGVSVEMRRGEEECEMGFDGMVERRKGKRSWTRDDGRFWFKSLEPEGSEQTRRDGGWESRT